MKKIGLVIIFFSVTNTAFSKDNECGKFEMKLEGSEKHQQLGKNLYRELYEEFEVLSLETKKIDICSFSCTESIEKSEAVECLLKFRLEYNYIPFVGEFYGVVYCDEKYLFDGESDYQNLSSFCNLRELPVWTE